jgi:hypothetical protein
MPKKRPDAPQIEPRMTDVAGAMRRGNWCKDKIYEMLREGLLESFLDGRSRKISIASIDRVIDSRLAESRGSFERARHPVREEHQHELETT